MDFAALGQQWRELEGRAVPSFFQSWTWTGCLAAERFTDPVLVEAAEAGRTVALVLFNRRRRWGRLATLHLHESGLPELDCPYIEQNGVLAQAGRETELTALCLRAVAHRSRIVLSGIGPDALAGVRRAAGLVVVERDQASPFADLAAIRAAGGDVLATCSANTRQQIRRSDRFFARHGPMRISRADTVETAQQMLDEMASLHQARWQARGKPGSFADPFFRRFHRALIAEGLPRGETLLLRVSAGRETIGILYNFVFLGRILAYQSGFVYRPEATQAKPGLTCHHAAMHYALQNKLDIYDFLAGEDRYKRSLSGSAHSQVWAEAGPWWSARLLTHRLRLHAAKRGVSTRSA